LEKLRELKYNRPLLQTDNVAWITKVNKWKSQHPYNYKRGNMKTQDVLVELNKYVQKSDDKYIFTSGVGNHQMMSTQYINWKYPNTFISSGSLGVMGTGLPYAVGAQIANPGKTVIDIDGDSSFNMTSSDLKTVVENNLPIKVLILNNSCQDMVRVWEELFFNDRITATTNKINPDYKKLAESYGMAGLYCNNSNELEYKLSQFMSYSDGPILLECNVEPDVCLPLVAPGCALDNMILYEDDIKNLDGECPS
jgi:acetolactate synthase-1/2/3 large subunit